MRARLLAIVGIVTLLAAGTAMTALRPAQSTAQSLSTPIVVNVPTWTLTVYELQDPYAGKLINPTPANVNAAMRYVGIDLALAATSYPLQVKAANVHLRDRAGHDYVMGATTGSEAKLPDREVLPGEVARGWVWFEIPKQAEIVQIVFIPAAAPELRMPYASVPLSAATPAPPTATATPAPTKTVSPTTSKATVKATSTP